MLFSQNVLEYFGLLSVSSCQVINWYIFRIECNERRKNMKFITRLTPGAGGWTRRSSDLRVQLFEMDVLRPAAPALFIVAKVIDLVIIVELIQVTLYLLSFDYWFYC